jgi:hypothetical protein
MMKKTLIALMLLPVCCFGQVTLETVIPKEPIIKGQSFQVQYVLENAGDASIETPVFKNFRFVTGPNIYKGTNRPVTNFVFTLEALQPGKFIIPGARVLVNGKKLSSDDVTIQVLQAKTESPIDPENSDYILRPGEDPWQKIRKNLFLKLLVDRKTCLVGQPVTATFKLYSRLESRSDITRNPGFYGFTVHDMVNLEDRVSEVEQVNGKLFDVHTIRKVQLYPLQAGKYTIDPMEVVNEVEFSKSTVTKKTEQEIIEGVVDKKFKKKAGEGTETFEITLSTNAVAINVNPLPEKNRPESFGGAVGNFSMRSSVEPSQLKANELGRLVITINGNGNFTQISAPAVEWPQAVESFEPIVKEELDKLKTPLQGSRSFIFPFLSVKSGHYMLPGIRFSFFDPGAGQYKTLDTAPLGIDIKKAEGKATKDQVLNKKDFSLKWILLAMLVIAGIIVLSIYSRRP